MDDDEEFEESLTQWRNRRKKATDNKQLREMQLVHEMEEQRKLEESQARVKAFRETSAKKPNHLLVPPMGKEDEDQDDDEPGWSMASSHREDPTSEVASSIHTEVGVLPVESQILTTVPLNPPVTHYSPMKQQPIPTSKATLSPLHNKVERLIRVNRKPGGKSEQHLGLTFSGGAAFCQPVRVEIVKFGSSADLCEVKRHDEVLAINGIPVSESYIDEVLEVLEREEQRDSRVTLLVRRNRKGSQEDDEESLSEISEMQQTHFTPRTPEPSTGYSSLANGQQQYSSQKQNCRDAVPQYDEDNSISSVSRDTAISFPAPPADLLFPDSPVDTSPSNSAFIENRIKNVRARNQFFKLNQSMEEEMLSQCPVSVEAQTLPSRNTQQTTFSPFVSNSKSVDNLRHVGHFDDDEANCRSPLPADLSLSTGALHDGMVNNTQRRRSCSTSSDSSSYTSKTSSDVDQMSPDERVVMVQPIAANNNNNKPISSVVYSGPRHLQTATRETAGKELSTIGSQLYSTTSMETMNRTQPSSSLSYSHNESLKPSSISAGASLTTLNVKPLQTKPVLDTAATGRHVPPLVLRPTRTSQVDSDFSAVESSGPPSHRAARSVPQAPGPTFSHRSQPQVSMKSVAVKQPTQGSGSTTPGTTQLLDETVRLKLCDENSRVGTQVQQKHIVISSSEQYIPHSARGLVSSTEKIHSHSKERAIEVPSVNSAAPPVISAVRGVPNSYSSHKDATPTPTGDLRVPVAGPPPLPPKPAKSKPIPQSASHSSMQHHPVRTPSSNGHHLKSARHNRKMMGSGQSGALPKVKPSKLCNHCGRELGYGPVMMIDSAQLYFHLLCFRCNACGCSLGDGTHNADVRIRNGRLHCKSCHPQHGLAK